jgi:hypothetical protein
MNVRESLELALKRLAIAIDQLEAVQSRRARALAAHADVEEELAVMQDDRSRLAVELDAAVARNKALMTANDEVAQRLERATDTIRDLLAGIEPAEPE